MSELTRTLTIVNRLGLHARAAGKLVNLAKTFSSDIRLSRGAETVDAKSIMKVMLLAAEVGSEVGIAVTGDDAAEAFEAVCLLIEDGFGELD